MIRQASIATITCGVAFGAAGLTGLSPAGAQTLESRANNVRNGTATFAYPTHAGVCGDGKYIVSRNSSNPDDYSVMEFNDGGTSWSSYNSRSRENMVRDCQNGPAHVVLTAADGHFTKVVVTVGGAAPSGTDLGTVSAEEASHFLLGLAATGTAKPERVGSRAIFAAALSDAQQQTTTELLAMTHRTSLPVAVRKDAVYWMSLSSDPRVTARLKELLADRNEDTDVRKSSIFALSRRDSPDVVQLLLNTARNSDQKDLKSDAVFWLGQMAGEKSTAGLKSILDDDSEEMEVRDAAVFALSNQKNDQSVTLLMDVATKSKEPHLRRTALFWLGKHSDDPRVLKLFEDLLTKN